MVFRCGGYTQRISFLLRASIREEEGLDLRSVLQDNSVASSSLSAYKGERGSSAFAFFEYVEQTTACSRSSQSSG